MKSKITLLLEKITMPGSKSVHVYFQFWKEFAMV